MRYAWLAIIAGAGAGCVPSFDPESLVVGLRLLAAKADPPEVAAGEMTTLEALVVDTEGRAIAVEWTACTLPAEPDDTTPVNPDCFKTEAQPYLIPLGTGGRVTFAAPAVDPRMLGIPDTSAGLYLPIRVRVSAGDASTVGVYGLRYSFLPVPRNHNPTITDVLEVTRRASDAGPEEAMPLDAMTPREVREKDKVTLRVAVSMDSVEMYPRFVGNPPMIQMKEERLTTRWFVSGGAIGGTTFDDLPYTTLVVDKPLPAVGEAIDLWGVTRDLRGGTDWVHRQVRLR